MVAGTCDMTDLKPLGLDRLTVHTITTKPLGFQECLDSFQKHGVSGITVWRNCLEGRPLQESARMLKDSGMEVVSLCRGGFFPSTEKAKREEALDDNHKSIEEAHAIGAPLIVLVCGSDPGLTLSDNRKQIAEGIQSLLPQCEAAGVKLGIEPLHPMYAGDRSAVNSMKQANDMVELIASPLVGVTVDVYHLWWDDTLESEIIRCGNMNALFSYHVCDWRVPTREFLTDRAIMGDGCIRLKEIRQWVENTGFNGQVEVEIFSDEWWSKDQNDYLEKIIHGFKNNT